MATKLLKDPVSPSSASSTDASSGKECMGVNKSKQELMVPATWLGFAATSSFTILVYCGVLAAMYHVLPHKGGDFWGTENNNWDAPEPNYLILPHVAEFWSVLTVIPLAGANNLRLAFKYNYDWNVRFMYIITIVMYTEAFASHMTLWAPIFSCTCTSVMSNAIYCFLVWGWAAGGILKNTFLRVIVAASGFALVVYLVRTLPHLEVLQPHSGLATLFLVQTPGVVLASIGATFCWLKTPGELGDSFKLLAQAGVLLTIAMALSLVEVLYGYEHGYLAWFGLPWMHLIVHTLEQVGIYMYGTGVAGLQHAGKRQIAIQWCGIVPYCSIASESAEKKIQ